MNFIATSLTYYLFYDTIHKFFVGNVQFEGNNLGQIL